MSKITLNNVASLIDATTAVNTINANSAVIQTAMDNTLSRDGTQPNVMAANVDMNSNRVLNLPTPSSLNEPARLVDLNTLTAGGTITVNTMPTGGTTGQVLEKNSSSNYDVSWQTINQMTSGGTTGQSLTKNSNTNFDTVWATITPLTSGGTSGQVLTKNSSTNFDASWLAPASVTSIAGNTGAFTLGTGITNSTNVIKLALTNQSAQTLPVSPAGTVSTSAVMCGLGSNCTLTPTYSGRLHVTFNGSMNNTTANDTVTASIRWGTGTAPVNGVGVTGTSVGGSASQTSPSVGYQAPFSVSAIVTGLTPGTTYWFDLAQSVNAGTGFLTSVAFCGFEF